MRRTLCLTLIAVALSAPSVAPSRIEVRPVVAPYGTPVRVRCYVPPSPENRWIDIGVEGFSISRVPLDDDSAPVQERTMREPPCGEQVAFCALQQTQNRDSRVTQRFQVACSAL